MSDQDTTSSERRTQARLSVEIPIKVKIPGRAELVDAINEDLSWGGAGCILSTQFILPEAVVRGAEEPLTLYFPWTGGDHIEIDATLARTHRLEDGRYRAALRFRSITPRNEARLEKLLTMLWQGKNKGDETGLVRELVLNLTAGDEMRRILEQVRSGELSIVSRDAYSRDESIRFVIHGEGQGLPSIGLRARVHRVRVLPSAEFGGDELYGLRLMFEHPLANIREVASLLLEQLPAPVPAPSFPSPPPAPPPSAAPSPRAPESTPAPPGRPSAPRREEQLPDWVIKGRIAESVNRPSLYEKQSPPPGDDPKLSALEQRHPNALTYLGVVWGDSEAFDAHFQDLIMGDYAEPGGWPDDAWSELSLLQDVHDTAYGVPAYRGTFLGRGG